MKTVNRFLALMAVFIFSSCSVMSPNIRKKAETPVSFETLRENVEGYVGKTVILGGHILEVRNLAKKTQIIVLQTPLDFQHRPKQKDQSEGRFVAVYDGFLDPEIYQKDRMITVGGPVLGRETVVIEGYSYPTVAVKSEEMHLWEKELKRQTIPFFPDPYYDPFYYDPFYPWPGPYRYPYLPPRPRLRR